MDRDLPNFSDIGRTRTDCFLKLAPLTPTRKHRPDYLSSDPPEEIFEQRPSVLKHWSLFTLQFLMRLTGICFLPLGTCLWYVARDLMNLDIAAERLVRFGPDRRRSTQGNDGNVVESISGYSRNGTCHMPYNLTKLPLESKHVARSRRGKRHSIRLYKNKTIRTVALRFV